MGKNAFVLMGCLAAFLMSAQAGAAKLGDPAAPLQIKTWLKGEAVDLAAMKGKKVVVVEFWATWCPPCRESIPHLTKLQKKYRDQAVFLGISNEPANIVEPFVKKMAEKMEYTVAIDDDGKTNKGYMSAYGVGGIPHAFIVDKNGVVVYADHPMNPDFEKVLTKVIAGTFNLEEHIAKKEKEKELIATFERYHELAESGEDEAKRKELGEVLFEGFADNERALAGIAMEIARGAGLTCRDLDLALRMSEKACEITKHEAAIPLHARACVLSVLGRLDEAVETQKKALDLAEDRDMRKAMKEQLREFENAAKKGVGDPE